LAQYTSIRSFSSRNATVLFLARGAFAPPNAIVGLFQDIEAGKPQCFNGFHIRTNRTPPLAAVNV
jgi:hypothetical protein